MRLVTTVTVHVVGYKTMTLATDEFIRRFLVHVLPEGLPSHPTLWAARHRSRRVPRVELHDFAVGPI